MNFVQKIFTFGPLIASWLIIPRSRRTVKQVQLADFKLLVFANEAVGRIIWLYRNFEKNESAYFKSAIMPDDICFDIGGNVGYFSMLMAKCVPSGQVHVFEPIPINAAMIELNKQINGFENVIINKMALGEQPGMAQFMVSEDSAYSSLKAEGEGAAGKAISVPVTRLDLYVRENGVPRIDIIKMDVEGAEGLVLGGIGDLLINPKTRPRMLMIELVDERLRNFGHTTSGIIDQLAQFGYQAKVCGKNARLSAFSTSASLDDYNVVFVSQNRNSA